MSKDAWIALYNSLPRTADGSLEVEATTAVIVEEMKRGVSGQTAVRRLAITLGMPPGDAVRKKDAQAEEIAAYIIEQLLAGNTPGDLATPPQPPVQDDEANKRLRLSQRTRELQGQVPEAHRWTQQELASASTASLEEHVRNLEALVAAPPASPEQEIVVAPPVEEHHDVPQMEGSGPWVMPDDVRARIGDDQEKLQRVLALSTMTRKQMNDTYGSHELRHFCSRDVLQCSPGSKAKKKDYVENLLIYFHPAGHPTYYPEGLPDGAPVATITQEETVGIPTDPLASTVVTSVETPVQHRPTIAPAPVAVTPAPSRAQVEQALLNGGDSELILTILSNLEKRLDQMDKALIVFIAGGYRKLPEHIRTSQDLLEHFGIQ